MTKAPTKMHLMFSSSINVRQGNGSLEWISKNLAINDFDQHVAKSNMKTISIEAVGQVKRKLALVSTRYIFVFDENET